ncbi:hypothetical protein JXA32_06720 [Candidatus Sumerlaeota bacterium]|nr:hypothetical protein [Candidatus Sumerlaeota bacterium]
MDESIQQSNANPQITAEKTFLQWLIPSLTAACWLTMPAVGYLWGRFDIILLMRLFLFVLFCELFLLVVMASMARKMTRWQIVIGTVGLLGLISCKAGMWPMFQLGFKQRVRSEIGFEALKQEAMAAIEMHQEELRKEGVVQLPSWYEVRPGSNFNKKIPSELKQAYQVIKPNHVNLRKSRIRDGQYYLNLDKGGGHIQPIGLLIGPPDFIPDRYNERDFIKWDEGIYFINTNHP